MLPARPNDDHRVGGLHAGLPLGPAAARGSQGLWRQAKRDAKPPCLKPENRDNNNCVWRRHWHARVRGRRTDRLDGARCGDESRTEFRRDSSDCRGSNALAPGHSNRTATRGRTVRGGSASLPSSALLQSVFKLKKLASFQWKRKVSLCKTRAATPPLQLFEPIEKKKYFKRVAADILSGSWLRPA